MIGTVPSIPENSRSLGKGGRRTGRKVVLAVKTWGSEESIHAWKYLKSHLLQTKDGAWNDELFVVHISKTKDKDKAERWDQGGAVIASLQTALQPYKHDIFDLEGDAGPLLVDVANKEEADILVLATRGRNVMKKAMMGSITEFVMQRVGCACLVMKPQVGAGDTYRMKSAAQPPGGAPALPNLQPPRSQSPAASPMYCSSSLPSITAFNRRVAIVYDTTASGRFLLKWAADNILEPADNIFVVRAVPKMRKPGTSFADKDSVQRLAGDALQGLLHITTFNLPQAQGNSRRSVLNFVAKESVDLVIIGMYKPNTRRRGLAQRGNAIVVANRCACPCLVVPMSEAALLASVKDTDLELAAAEEEELASCSESETDDDEPDSPPALTPAIGIPGEKVDTDVSNDAAVAVTPPGRLHDTSGSPEVGGGLASFRSGSAAAAAAMKHIRAPLDALFKRRGSGAAGSFSDSGGAVGLDARRTALLAALQGNTSSLQPGRYSVEVDSHGVVRGIKAPGEKQHHLSAHTPSEPISADSPRILSSTYSAPVAEIGAATPPPAADWHPAEPELVMVDSLGGGIPDRPNDAAPQAEQVEAPLNPAGAGADAEVQRLQQMLADREAQVLALRQQLQQLSVAAAGQ